MNILRCCVLGASILILVPLSSCDQGSTAPNQLSGNNLIQNPTFEAHGQPSLQSWTSDTALAKIVQDAPPGDGMWSLQLLPGWTPQEGFAQTYVGGQSGVGVYKLTVWMKCINGWRGSLSLGIWSQNAWVSRKSVSSDSSQWSIVSLMDTMSLSATDSIAVHLSAGATELSGGRVLFDDVSLERLR